MAKDVGGPREAHRWMGETRRAAGNERRDPDERRVPQGNGHAAGPAGRGPGFGMEVGFQELLFGGDRPGGSVSGTGPLLGQGLRKEDGQRDRDGEQAGPQLSKKRGAEQLRGAS